MKTLADIETRLKQELWQWVTKQSTNIYDAYYLYYLPSSPEHDGGLLIAKDKPANTDYQLAWPQRISPAATVEQNFNLLRFEVLRTLPILSY